MSFLGGIHSLSRTVIDEVMDFREKSWMGKAEVYLIHNAGADHQGKMVRRYASLSNGATSYYGTYECPECGVTVSIRLNAHPDIPYELYDSSEESVKE